MHILFFKSNKVFKFVEKPSELRAKKIISKKGYWNCGIFFAKKESIVNNFKKHCPKIYKNCLNSVIKSKFKPNHTHLDLGLCMGHYQ